jgi:hypothetical protein
MSIEQAIKMSDVGKQVHLRLKVTGVRPFRWRMAAALQVLKLAAWLAPVDMIVEAEGEDDDHIDTDDSSFPPRAWTIDRPGIYPAGHPALLRLEVMLDGKKIDYVRGWDCDKGIVKVIETDASGLMQMTEDRSAVLEKVLRGRVTIRERASA